NRVREQLARMADEPPQHEAEIDHLLDGLDELERLWAYPGSERIAHLRHLRYTGDWAELRVFANEVADRLSAHGDRAAIAEDGTDTAGAAYFTVLLVDSGAPEELATFRRHLRELRANGPGDLVYDVVRVGSFEEAWLAVACNTDIQA